MFENAEGGKPRIAHAEFVNRGDSHPVDIQAFDRLALDADYDRLAKSVFGDGWAQVVFDVVAVGLVARPQAILRNNNVGKREVKFSGGVEGCGLGHGGCWESG